MAFSLKGIFLNVFGNKSDVKVSTSKMVNLFTPYFSPTTDPKLNDTFMTGINTHAAHISKIKPKVFLKDIEDKKWLTKLLSLRPNPIMSAGTFWEKVGRNYFLDNNVFIYLDWDLTKLKTPLKSLWVLDPTAMDVSYNKGTGEFYLKFMLQGSEITTNLDNIIHIPRQLSDSEIFGTPSTAINKVLSVININYDGIENAIKSSAFLRFVISSTMLLNDKDKAKKAKDFADTYLSKDGTGIAWMDASSSITQVNSEAKYSNEKEMEFFEAKILNYLNISKDIVSADFTEVQWQSYYETNIEPLANKLQDELTAKIFTNREYDMGNRVVISSSELQVISLKSKINLLSSTKEIGLYTLNEYRKMFNMPPVEDGDKRLMSLNYIDSSLADEYQLNQSKLKLKKQKEVIDDEK
jgi:HK97 family phage portal protein